jgi:hypothetical protein
MPNSYQFSVLKQAFSTQKQAVTMPPQNLGRLVQTVVHHFFPNVRPTRFTTTTYISLLVIPPKLKAAERPIPTVLHAQNAGRIQQLLDLKLVFDSNLLHRRILPDKLPVLPMAFLSPPM